MSLTRTRRLALQLLFIAAASSGAAWAQGQPSKGEQALKYRKALYQVIAWNFGPMSAMAQGKIQYDAADFALRAGHVAELTPMLAESYTPDSQDVANSRLKPEMWQNRADFDAKLKDLVDRSATLAQVAKTGDPAMSKEAFFDTANACKACHEKYRAD
jgi:cytochrome c556